MFPLHADNGQIIFQNCVSLQHIWVVTGLVVRIHNYITVYIIFFYFTIKMIKLFTFKLSVNRMTRRMKKCDLGNAVAQRLSETPHKKHRKKRSKSRTPERHKSKTAQRGRSRKSRSRTPKSSRSRTPTSSRSRTPRRSRKSRSRTPKGHRSITPTSSRSRTPKRGRSRTPKRGRSRTPQRHKVRLSDGKKKTWGRFQEVFMQTMQYSGANRIYISKRMF